MIKTIHTANDAYEAIKHIPTVSIHILDFARDINSASNAKALNIIADKFVLYKSKNLQEDMNPSAEIEEMVRLIELMIVNKHKELKARHTML